MFKIENLEWLFNHKNKILLLLQKHPSLFEKHPQAINYLNNILYKISELDFPILKEDLLENLKFQSIGTEPPLSEPLTKLIIECGSLTQAEETSKISTTELTSQSAEFTDFLQVIAATANKDKESILRFVCRLHSISNNNDDSLDFIVDIVLPLWEMFLKNPLKNTSYNSPLEILARHKAVPPSIVNRYQPSAFKNFRELFLDLSYGEPSGTNFSKDFPYNLPSKIQLLTMSRNMDLFNHFKQISSSLTEEKQEPSQQTQKEKQETNSRSVINISSYQEILPSSVIEEEPTTLTQQLTRVIRDESKYIEFIYEDKNLSVTHQLAQDYIEAFIEVLRDHLELEDEDEDAVFDTTESNNVIIQSFLEDADENISNFLKNKSGEIRKIARIEKNITDEMMTRSIQSYLDFADRELTFRNLLQDVESLEHAAAYLAETEPLQGLPIAPEDNEHSVSLASQRFSLFQQIRLPNSSVPPHSNPELNKHP